MKILLVHHRLPFPPRSGMDKASINLFRILSKVHHTTLVVPYWQPPTQEVVEQLQAICSELVLVPVKNQAVSIHRPGFKYWRRLLRIIFWGIPGMITDNYYPEMERVIQNIIQSNPPDLIQATSLATASYLSHDGLTVSSVIFHDNSFELYRQYSRYTKSLFHKILCWLEYKAYLKFEPQVYLKCDCPLFLSVANMEHMQRYVGNQKKASHLPIVVELEGYQPRCDSISNPITGSHNLVFVGGLGPLFNRDAVIFFCQEILPLVLERINDVKFYIVGDNPSNEILRLGINQHIVVTGEVPDVSMFIKNSTVYVAPLRIGGGVKTKMIEALNYGKAIVTTSTSISGLWDKNDNAFLVCDTPETFAAKVVRLLECDEERLALEHSARELYERSYSHHVLVPEILIVYKEIEESMKEKTEHFYGK